MLLRYDIVSERKTADGSERNAQAESCAPAVG